MTSSYLNAACIALLCATWTPSSGAAQPYATIEGVEGFGAHMVVDHGWALVTSSDLGLATVYAVDLEQGTETDLMRGVSEPAHGFASLENGEATVAVLIGTDSGNAFSITPANAEIINSRSPLRRITHFGVAEIGTGAETLHQVGGFVGSDFFWLDSTLNLGDPASVDTVGLDVNPSAGVAGGRDSVIIGTTTGPTRIHTDGMRIDLRSSADVLALVGNERRGIAMVHNPPGGPSLARIITDNAVEILDALAPTDRHQMATAAGGLLAWVERGGAIETVIRIAPAGRNEATFSLTSPVEGDVFQWATVIATDGTYLVAASPELDRLDLFDLRCYEDSERDCPMGTACTPEYNHCVAPDAGSDAGPGMDAGSDAGPADAGPASNDADVPDSGADTGSSTETGPPESLAPRSELSCTCRAAGDASSGRLPFVVGCLLCLTLAVRRPRRPRF